MARLSVAVVICKKPMLSRALVDAEAVQVDIDKHDLGH